MIQHGNLSTDAGTPHLIQLNYFSSIQSSKWMEFGDDQRQSDGDRPCCMMYGIDDQWPTVTA
jgi:hypothetical protein